MDSKVTVTLVDALASVVVLLAARWASPQDAQLVKELVFALQPAVIVLIGAITLQQKATIDAAGRVNEALAYLQTTPKKEGVN